MKRVLVTGANGFIGRHSLSFLIERGYELHGIISENGGQLGISGVHWHIANLLNPTSAQAVIKAIRPTHLLHFAWYTKPGEFWSSAENLRWLQSSLEILRAFKFNGGERVLMAGTCAEYDWHYGYCSEQITPLNPATLYGSCKKSLYEVLMSFARQEGLSAAWGRVFFLYGPYEHPARLVPSITTALLAKRYANCTQGDQIRDFLHVEDVASAFAALLDSKIDGAINIASGQPVTIKKVIRLIAEKLGRLDLVQFGAISTSQREAPFLVADVNRLHQQLGWIPSHNLDTGLDTAIDWWKKQKTHI